MVDLWITGAGIRGRSLSSNPVPVEILLDDVSEDADNSHDDDDDEGSL